MHQTLLQVIPSYSYLGMYLILAAHCSYVLFSLRKLKRNNHLAQGHSKYLRWK